MKNKQTPIDTIYLDMDGVLVDIQNSIDFFNINWESITNADSRPKEQIIYEKIYGMPSFLLYAKPFKHAKRLYMLCYRITSNVYFLSQSRISKRRPEHQKIVRANKIQWLQKNISSSISSERVIVVHKNKSKYSNSANLLIDDRKLHTTKWKNKGGISIHFTNYGNCLYRLRLLVGNQKFSTYLSCPYICKNSLVRKKLTIKR